MSNYASQAQACFFEGVYWELHSRYTTRAHLARELGRSRANLKSPSLEYTNRVARRYWDLLIDTARQDALTDHGCDGLGCGGTLP